MNTDRYVKRDCSNLIKFDKKSPLNCHNCEKLQFDVLFGELLFEYFNSSAFGTTIATLISSSSRLSIELLKFISQRRVQQTLKRTTCRFAILCYPPVNGGRIT
jgi:hypothetical protein